jgi:hypothetical protein
METPKKIQRARPIGRIVPHEKTFRLATEDLEALAELTRRWNCSESEVVRRLLRDAVTTNNPEGDGPAPDSGLDPGSPPPAA